MKSREWLLGGLCAVGLLAGCGDPNLERPVDTEDPELSLDTSEAPLHSRAQRLLGVRLKGLQALGAGYVYEGWLIVDGQPVSAGRFNLRGADQTLYFVGPAALLSRASAYVLTLEPAVGDDPAPSEVHVLAGDLAPNRRGQLDAALSVAHPAAFGQDFSSAAGQYILQTPSSAAKEDYAQGIWFVNPAARAPSLQLPSLPKGWVYEGWVVSNGAPVSTGRFTAVAGEDSDGAGPQAGPLPGPAFPGQDFIQPPLNLVGGAVVVSVEPADDDSPKPFALKPLVDAHVDDVGPGTLQPLQNQAAANNPRGRAVVF